MMGIALVLPWYAISSELAGEKFESRYSFGGIESNLEGSVEFKAWGDEALESYKDTRGVYGLTQILTIFGLILAILLLIGAFMVMKGKGKQYAFFFALLTLIFCLLAPIVFMATHAGAIAEDMGSSEGTGPQNSFSGSEEDDSLGITVKASWGPSSGFYMTIIGFIFALLAFILSFKIPKPELTLPTQPQETARAPMPMAVQQTAGYPGYQGYPQQQTYPPQQPPAYPPQG
jgi:hypothetical protein